MYADSLNEVGDIFLDHCDSHTLSLRIRGMGEPWGPQLEAKRIAMG